jgi:hypothetical protein
MIRTALLCLLLALCTSCTSMGVPDCWGANANRSVKDCSPIEQVLVSR